MKLNYEEQQALQVLRKSLQRNPEMATALLEGMGKEVAVKVLVQAKVELSTLLTITREVMKVSEKLLELEKQNENQDE